MALQDLVIITGFSGAGKSTAMAAFEDEGYFCVDNLPSGMVGELVDMFIAADTPVTHAAIVSHVRGGTYFEGLPAVLDQLEERGIPYRMLFLEADEETLSTRYKETRRRHPLAPDGSVAEGIAREAEALRALRRKADVLIETDEMTASQLRRRLADEMLPNRNPGRLSVTFESFGFKYGPARDTDLLFDVRFLPNPHYDKQLRPLTGQDQRVVEYANTGGALDTFYEHLEPMLDYLLPQYLAEGKAHLVVAIGCTGGRHRSVAVTEHLARRYEDNPRYVVQTIHRDIDNPP